MIENDGKGRPCLVSKWTIEDVLTIRPDLSPDQAVEVLQVADECFDAEFGITWEILREHARGTFPRSRVQEAYDNAVHSFEEQEWAGAGAWIADYLQMRLEELQDAISDSEDAIATLPDRAGMDAIAIKMLRELPWPGDS